MAVRADLGSSDDFPVDAAIPRIDHLNDRNQIVIRIAVFGLKQFP
jgi:hypothetical protein